MKGYEKTRPSTMISRNDAGKFRMQENSRCVLYETRKQFRPLI